MDDAVVERTKAGDAGAWRALVGRHVTMVRAICTGYGLDERTSAEVNQVVWLRLVEHLPRIRTPDAIGGWIAATTRSECLSPRRDAARSGWVTADVAAEPGRDVARRNGAHARHVGCDEWARTPCAPVGVRREANHREAGRRETGHRAGAGDRAAAGTAAAAGTTISATPTPPDVASAFTRLGARCQRLLRLVATTPRPSDQHVSAALDIDAGEVAAACAHCLDRLCRMVDADVPAVWAELRRLVGARGVVPPSWWAAADAAFAWLILDAGRADLVYDSTAPSDDTDGTGRTLVGRPARQLRFAQGDDRVELALDTRDGEVVLSGRLTPGRCARVTVHWPGGWRRAGSGAEGDFLLEHLPAAPLCVEVDGPSPFKTGWIVP